MRRRALTPQLLSAVAARFKVLAEPARLQVLHALEQEPLHVSGLIEATGLNQANLSKHLQVLHAHGFVSRRRAGTFVYYEIADPAVFTLCQLMCSEVERQAHQTLAGWGA